MAEQKKEIVPERIFSYWDIESCPNIFMFGIYVHRSMARPGLKDSLMFFHLCDDWIIDEGLQKEITDCVFDGNAEYDIDGVPELSRDLVQISFHDMKDYNVNLLLLRLFNVSNKPFFGKESENDFGVLVPNINTDITADADWPYMVDYNGANYDRTMMSVYFNETWGFTYKDMKESMFQLPTKDARSTKIANFMPTTAKFMRDFNNTLFDAFRENMPNALKGNEENIYRNINATGMFVDASKVNDKVYKMPLKRIEGMLGLDIYEDEDVTGGQPIDTKAKLLKLFAYNASDLAKTEIVFQHGTYKAQFDLKRALLNSYPDIVFKDNEVRAGRVRVDDTSAKFAAKILCPDGFLKDTRAVTFEYPKGSGRNVLQETREWAQDKFKEHPEVYNDFIKPILDYFGTIEGKNFDSSEHYDQTYPIDGLPVSDLRAIPWPMTTIPYFKKDGTITSTYVNFGVGGIHGAEFNLELYKKDMEAYKAEYQRIDWFVKHFTPDELATLKTKTIIDGVEYKTSEYVGKSKKEACGYKIKYPKPVELFKKDTKSGKWGLNKKYIWCSDDEVDHQDFTSYYPGLLMQLQAFLNEMLGEDRYVEQFNKKTSLGKLMKDDSLPKEQKKYYKNQREGTKLILNSASGAADTTYDTNIRMNNVIIAMRIIGQLFTWRIGQAETLEGYKVTSTNTDGLYAACNEQTRPHLREILEREAKSIGVPIEPEEMRLITKDTNNRVEVSLDGKVLSASGADVGCWEGPVLTKAIAHPAIIDTLMVRYMVKYGVNEPFDEMRAAEVLENIKKETDPTALLILYQTMLNSSPNTCRYIFGMLDNGKIMNFQHNNRAFAIKSAAAHMYIANGCKCKINEAPKHDDIADQVLRDHNIDPGMYDITKIVKIPKIDPQQNVLIYNKSLVHLPEETKKQFIANIDDGFYISMFRNTYNNWCNVSEHAEDDDDDGNGAA